MKETIIYQITESSPFMMSFVIITKRIMRLLLTKAEQRIYGGTAVI